MLDTVEKFILLPAWRANAGAYKTTERYSSWKKKKTKVLLWVYWICHNVIYSIEHYKQITNRTFLHKLNNDEDNKRCCDRGRKQNIGSNWYPTLVKQWFSNVFSSPVAKLSIAVTPEVCSELLFVSSVSV